MEPWWGVRNKVETIQKKKTQMSAPYRACVYVWLHIYSLQIGVSWFWQGSGTKLCQVHSSFCPTPYTLHPRRRYACWTRRTVRAQAAQHAPQPRQTCCPCVCIYIYFLMCTYTHTLGCLTARFSFWASGPRRTCCPCIYNVCIYTYLICTYVICIHLLYM